MSQYIKLKVADINTCTKIVESEKEVIGIIRAELANDLVMVHPLIYIMTKDRYKLFKKEFFSFMDKLKIDYGYEHYYALTLNSRMVDTMSDGRAEAIGEILGRTLYECEI
jgi:hypothetical protein|tara:strand:+ start:193 stop:522 length:330 start_codon:yes stop_codon:yes gene_type:complete